MTRRARIRPRARLDMLEHHVYLEQRREKLGGRFLDAVEETVKELAALPEMGSPQPLSSARLVGVRKWRVRGFEKYLIFYRPSSEGVEVLRVIHAARELSSLLLDEDLDT